MSINSINNTSAIRFDLLSGEDSFTPTGTNSAPPVSNMLDGFMLKEAKRLDAGEASYQQDVLRLNPMNIKDNFKLQSITIAQTAKLNVTSKLVGIVKNGITDTLLKQQ